MRGTSIFVAVASLIVLATCGGGTTPEDLKASPLYDGTLKITATTSAGPARIEISAGILPMLADFKGTPTAAEDGLYSHEGPNYPKTYAEAVEVVRRASIPYAELLKRCAALHSEITVEVPGQTLTDEQLWANLEAVWNCAYLDFGTKPYWIPQLIEDVDVCAVVLGEGWRLPSEADLAAFSDAARQVFVEAARIELALNNGTDIYARGADGKLRRGSMQPGVRTLSAIEYPTWQASDGSKYHYEGNGSSGGTQGSIGLRCVRAEGLIP